MANVTAPSLSIDDGAITWEDMTIDGNLTLNGNITLGSGGSYAAGSLFADSNWGMIFRAKTSNPAAADFLWTDGASDDHLMKLDNATGLSVHNGTYRFQAAEVTGSTDVFLVRSGATTNAGGNDRAAWIQHVRSSADANKWRFWFAQDNNSGASNVMTMAFNNASIPKGTVGIGTDAPTRSLDIRHNNHRGATSTDDVDYQAAHIYADNYGNTITNTDSYGLLVKTDFRGFNTGGTYTGSQGIAAKFITDSSWGVLPNGFGIIVQPEVYNHQTMTNYYGLYVQAPELGTGAVLTNKWGVYVADATYDSYFAGDVGIGTATPTHRLHIAGTNNGELPLLRLENTDSGSSAYAEVDIYSSSANLRMGITDPEYSGWTGSAFIRNQTNGQIRIGTATNNNSLIVDSYGAYINGDIDTKSIITNTGTGTAIIAIHTGAGTPVPWDIREQSSANSNLKTYGPLWITRMNATADGAGSNIHFRMKKNNGDPFEVGGIGASIEAGLTSSANVNGQLNFYTTSNNSTRIQRMTINHDGEVGINVTDPTYRLHTSGNHYFGGDMYLNNTGNKIEPYSGYVSYQSNGYTRIQANSSIYLAVDNDGSGTDAGVFVRANNTGDNLFAFLETGKVGIGLSNPNEALTVAGNIQIDSLKTGQANNADIDKITMSKAHNSSPGNPAAPSQYDLFEIRSVTTNGYAGGADFYYGKHTGGGGYGLEHVMRIGNPNGFTDRACVSIGNTGPATGSWATGADNLIIGDGVNHEGMTIYTGNDKIGSISFTDAADPDGYSGYIQYLHGTQGNKMVFGAAGNSRMELYSSYLDLKGNNLYDVGNANSEWTASTFRFDPTESNTGMFEIAPAGGTNTSYFQVYANAASGTSDGRNGGVTVIDANYYAAASTIFGVWGRGTEKFKLIGSGNATLAGTLTQNSDVRLKENIRPIDGALDLVKQVEGIKFERKLDGESNYGFVAQDIEPIIPELVRTSSEDEQYKSVAYQNAVPILVEAIKELAEEVRKLKALEQEWHR